MNKLLISLLILALVSLIRCYGVAGSTKRQASQQLCLSASQQADLRQLRQQVNAAYAALGSALQLLQQFSTSAQLNPFQSTCMNQCSQICASIGEAVAPASTSTGTTGTTTPTTSGTSSSASTGSLTGEGTSVSDVAVGGQDSQQFFVPDTSVGEPIFVSSTVSSGSGPTSGGGAGGAAGSGGAGGSVFGGAGTPGAGGAPGAAGAGGSPGGQPGAPGAPGAPGQVIP